VTGTGSLWVPLEMTNLCQEGRCFYDAWSRAATLNKLLQNRSGIEIISFNESTHLYPSFPLPEAGFRKAIELSDLSVRIAESMTVLHMKREDVLNSEITRVEDLIKKTNSAEDRNRLGILLCRYGIIKKAKKQFLSILEDDENNAKAHHNLGNICLIKSDFDEAVEHYKKADEYGRDPEVLYNMAMAYALKKDKIKAEEILRKAYGNLTDKEEEKKVAWMLGVSDLRYEKMSLSQPHLEAFKAVIYKVIPDKHLMKGSAALGNRPSDASWKKANQLPDFLWGNFKGGVGWVLDVIDPVIDPFKLKSRFSKPTKKCNLYLSEVVWWKF